MSRWTTRFLLASIAILPLPAMAKVFVFGDTTPVFSLTTLPPTLETQEGNQQLFLRFAGMPADLSHTPSVLIRTGPRLSNRFEHRWFSAHAVPELVQFYGWHQARVRDLEKVDPDELQGVDLLIMGVWKKNWDRTEMEAIRTFVSASPDNHLLVLLDCQRSVSEVNELLAGVGSSLQVESDCVARQYWAEVVDHEFTKGIEKVAIGSSLPVIGGEALMVDSDGHALLSVDNLTSLSAGRGDI